MWSVKIRFAILNYWSALSVGSSAAATAAAATVAVAAAAKSTSSSMQPDGDDDLLLLGKPRAPIGPGELLLGSDFRGIRIPVSAVATISKKDAMTFFDLVHGGEELRVVGFSVYGEGIGSLRWMRCCCVARQARDDLVD